MFRSSRQTVLRSVAAPLLLALAIMTSTLPMPGCGKVEPKKALAEASEAAKDIGGGTRDTINAVSQAFDAKLLTLEQKDKLADLLIAIAKGGQKGVAALQAIEASGVTELDLTQREMLNRLFDEAVIAPFLDLLTELGKLSNESSAAIRAALAAVRTAILLFSQKIGRATEIELLIQQREFANA